MLQKSATQALNLRNMPKPYLQRRGETYSFRIAVPTVLRPLLGVRELTRTLQTSDQRIAVPRAFYLASKALQVFAKLLSMSDKQRDELRIDFGLEIDLDELGFPKRITVQGELHEQEAINSALKTALETAPKRSQSIENQTPHGTPIQRSYASQLSVPAPTLKMVVDGFLAAYNRNKKPAMFKKHRPVLMMLLDVVGDKPVSEIKQADINAFFVLLEKLPPRWNDECRKRNLTLRQLAELNHPITLGPKSFDDTYKASVRAFLKGAKKDWKDQGFPIGLSTEGIEYRGDREEGEEKQRAFKAAELKRLFEGTEMQGFAADPAQAHCYWLPHIGLFTGARVNEICQINPQTDILEEPETGIWYFWITDETDGDERIDKRVKNPESRRKIPIHSKLLELGIRSYIERVKKAGAKLLFPAWKPSRRKASVEAEKLFHQLLKDTCLREETLGAQIVGMHAFRHTLESKGANTKGLPWPIEHITGHAIPGQSKVARGYKGELALSNKQEIMEAIHFDIDFIKPIE